MTSFRSMSTLRCVLGFPPFCNRQAVAYHSISSIFIIKHYIPSVNIFDKIQMLFKILLSCKRVKLMFYTQADPYIVSNTFANHYIWLKRMVFLYNFLNLVLRFFRELPYFFYNEGRKNDRTSMDTALFHICPSAHRSET